MHHCSYHQDQYYRKFPWGNHYEHHMLMPVVNDLIQVKSYGIYALIFDFVLSMFYVVIFTHVTSEVCFSFFVCLFFHFCVVFLFWIYYNLLIHFIIDDYFQFGVMMNEAEHSEHSHIRPWLELVCHMVYLSFSCYCQTYFKGACIKLYFHCQC